MKTPYCIIDNVKYQLHYDENGTVRFPDDGREMPDLNQMAVDYFRGKIKLQELFDYYINSGSPYSLVYGCFSRGGINNHTVTQGNEPTKKFRVYYGKR